MSRTNKNIYSSAYKYKVVMESFQRDTTIKTVQEKFNVPQSVISKWRMAFIQRAPSVFDQVNKKRQPSNPSENIDELKKIIGELTVQNEILKKALDTPI